MTTTMRNDDDTDVDDDELDSGQQRLLAREV